MHSIDKKMKMFLNTRGFEESGDCSWRTRGIDVTILYDKSSSTAIVLSPLKGCLYEEYIYIQDRQYVEHVFNDFKHKVVGLLRAPRFENCLK